MSTKLKDQWTTTREVKAIAGGHRMWLTQGHDGYGNESLIFGLQFDPTAGESGWVTLSLGTSDWDEAAQVANWINGAYRRDAFGGVDDALRRAALIVSAAGWEVAAEPWDEGFNEDKVYDLLGMTYTRGLGYNAAREEAEMVALGRGIWGPLLLDTVHREARHRYLTAEYEAGLG